MENDNIIIAKREDAHKSFYGTLSTLGLFTIFLVIDLIFYLRDKSVWQLVLLIISAVLVGFALIGLLFGWSNFRYAKRVANTPLISYDKNKNEFIVMDFIFHKEFGINKNDIIEIKTTDKGDAYIWYTNKDGKKTSSFIGFSDKASEDLINNELQKYKNLYN